MKKYQLQTLDKSYISPDQLEVLKMKKYQLQTFGKSYISPDLLVACTFAQEIEVPASPRSLQGCLVMYLVKGSV